MDNSGRQAQNNLKREVPILRHLRKIGTLPSFTLLNFILAMIGTSWHVASFVLPSN